MFTTKESVKITPHIGMVMLWTKLKADIPVGWQVSDGTNGTIDLRNQFIRGSRSDSELSNTVADSTARPNSSFKTNTDSHNHTVNPASFNATSGNQSVDHSHEVNPPKTTSNSSGLEAGWTYALCSKENSINILQRESQSNGPYNMLGFDDKFGSNDYAMKNSSHNHSVDITAFDSGRQSASHNHAISIDVPITTSSTDSHSHTITSGGDSETAPMHIRIFYIAYVG